MADGALEKGFPGSVRNTVAISHLAEDIFGSERNRYRESVGHARYCVLLPLCRNALSLFFPTPARVPPTVSSSVQFPTRNSQIAIHQLCSSPFCHGAAALPPIPSANSPTSLPGNHRARDRPFASCTLLFALLWSHPPALLIGVESLPLQRYPRLGSPHHILTREKSIFLPGSLHCALRYVCSLRWFSKARSC